MGKFPHVVYARRILRNQRLSVHQILAQWPVKEAPTTNELAGILRRQNCPRDRSVRPRIWGPWR